jgi:site-specific recombinase XerD
MLSALRRVLQEARRLKLMDADDYDSAVDLKGIKSTQLLRGRALSGSEVAALMDVCLDDPTLLGVRDAAMISILMAGLRRSEVVNLDVEDFDPKTGTNNSSGQGVERPDYLSANWSKCGSTRLVCH